MGGGKLLINSSTQIHTSPLLNCNPNFSIIGLNSMERLLKTFDVLMVDSFLEMVPDMNPSRSKIITGLGGRGFESSPLTLTCAEKNSNHLVLKGTFNFFCEKSE